MEAAEARVEADADGTDSKALEDLLEEVIGEFDDETDPVPRGRRLR